jgi:Leucine-rich repeat (LRR) protein
MTETPEQIAEARIAEALKTEATQLGLRGLGLSALPDAIGKLTALQLLYLRDNQLSALPERSGS